MRWAEPLRLAFVLVPILTGAALSAVPAHAGRIVLVSADLGEHCFDHGAMCRYADHVVRHVRGGARAPALPVLLVDRGEQPFRRALELAGSLGGTAVPFDVVDPRGPAFATAALDPARYSAIVIGSDVTCGVGRGGTCGALNERGSAPDSLALTQRAAEIAAFVNAGGGLLMLSGGNHGDGQRSGGADGYYDAIPAPPQRRADSPPFALTPAGRAIGITDGASGTPDELNCGDCSVTHNAFAVGAGDPVWTVLVRGSSGLAAAVATSGDIIDGVIAPDAGDPPGLTAPPASLPPQPLPAPGPATLGATVPAPVFADATSVRLPPAAACVSRRRFRIRIREIGVRLAAATVRLEGRRVAVRRGRRLTATVDLRGLPRGSFAVRISATTTSGRVLTGARRYRTCTPRIQGGVPKL